MYICMYIYIYIYISDELLPCLEVLHFSPSSQRGDPNKGTGKQKHTFERLKRDLKVT